MLNLSMEHSVRKEKIEHLIVKKTAEKNKDTAQAVEREDIFAPYLEQLIAERTKLDRAITDYDFRDFQTILNPEDVSDETFETIAASWLDRVRSTTEYLKPLDSLGIRIFAEDLECQPAFPEHSISFSSKTVATKSLLDASHIGGLAQVMAPVIEIGVPKPVLREQLFFMVSQGHVGQACEVLIHELIHRYHFRKHQQIHGILTEAQAYFSGIYGNPEHFSTQRIAEVLTKQPSDTEAALYKFNAKATEAALDQVAALYGMGLSYAEVSDILTASNYDEKTHRFEPLSSKVEDIKRTTGFDQAELKKLHDIYQAHAYNENAKARLALFDAIQESVSLKELRTMRLEKLRGKILRPTFFNEGKRFIFPDQYRQQVICPMDSKYPYDPDTLCTGIAFGSFIKEGHEKPVFAIGRWEAQPNSSKIVFPDTFDAPEDAEQEFVNDVRQEAASIRFNDKKNLAATYADRTLYEIPLARSILRAIISPEEWKTIIHDSLPDFSEKINLLTGVFEGVSLTGLKLDPESIRKLQAYRKTVDSIQTIFDYSGQKPEDFDIKFAEQFRSLEFTLSTLLGRD